MIKKIDWVKLSRLKKMFACCSLDLTRCIYRHCRFVSEITGTARSTCEIPCGGRKFKCFLDLKSSSTNTMDTINTKAFLLQHTCWLSVYLVLWEACGFPHPATAELSGTHALSRGAGNSATCFSYSRKLAVKWYRRIQENMLREGLSQMIKGDYCIFFCGICWRS